MSHVILFYLYNTNDEVKWCKTFLIHSFTHSLSLTHSPSAPQDTRAPHTLKPVSLTKRLVWLSAWKIKSNKSCGEETKGYGFSGGKGKRLSLYLLIFLSLPLSTWLMNGRNLCPVPVIICSRHFILVSRFLQPAVSWKIWAASPLFLCQGERMWEVRNMKEKGNWSVFIWFIFVCERGITKIYFQ